MVVELVGPSGAGKTTIAKELSRLNPVRYKIVSPYNIYSVLIYFYSPFWFYKTLKFLFKLGGINLLFSKSGLNWFFVSGAALHETRKKSNEDSVVIFDQLTFQALRRISRKVGRSQLSIVRDFYYLIPPVNVYVPCDARKDTIEYRRSHRDGEKVDLDGESFKRHWNDTISSIKEYCRILGLYGNLCLILNINSEIDLSENTLILDDFLNDIFITV